MKLQYTLLSIIIGLAFILRIIAVAQLPAILNRDEAALAYNALLLKESGVDEWGRAWPLTLESFGDFKLPGYSWWLVILFHVFPLADWVVKLPAVLAGTLLAVVVFWWQRRWFKHQWQPLIASALVVFSPVFIFYSRIAFESVVALTYLVGALACLLPLTTKPSLKLDVVGCFLLILAVFTYNTPLMLLPAIMVLIIVSRGVKKVKSWVGPIAFIALLMTTMLLILAPLTAQKSSITIFSDETLTIAYGEYRASFSGVSQKLLGNKYVYWLGLIAERTLASWSPNFLVFHGGQHPWHQVFNTGHLVITIYGSSLLGMALGMLRWMRGCWDQKRLALSKPESFLFLLTLASLAPSVITVDAPHATRSLLFFVCLGLWAAYGISRILELPLFKFRWIVIALFALLAVDIGGYVYRYFTQYPLQQDTLQPGFEQVLRQAETLPADKKIAIVDPSGYQYILTAWYLKLSPPAFFDTIQHLLPDRIGFKYGEEVGRYHFIADAQDRLVRGETVLIFWNADSKQWVLKEFP